MAIQTVASYKTSDNRLFASKFEAEKHETMIDIRGKIQTKLGTGIAAKVLNPTTFAEMIVEDPDTFYSILLSLRRKEAGNKASLQKKGFTTH
jgi:dsDNA-binding SOS-regulon protein